MTSRRLLAAILAIGATAAACATTPGPDGSAASPAAGAEASPDGSSSPGGSVSPGSTAKPDLGSLRVRADGWRTDFTKASVDLGEFFGGGPPKDGIPPVDEPRFESIDAARGWLTDRSPVVSLEAGGKARAYPLAILTWHEIVNDSLGGVPVVVTFCPLCNTALVFARELDGTIHDFGTTGNLRFSDLVMYDRQTESWWQQATGEAVVGELTGKRLTFLPAQIIGLGAFAAAHPDGDVLSRETGFSRDYGRNPYPGYDEAGDRPFLYSGVIDGRLAPKERVVTVGEGAEALALPFSELRMVGVAPVTVDGSPAVVLWAPGAASALGPSTIDDGEDVGASGVFRPIAEGRELTFERRGGEDAPITDVETGSTWSVTGLATTGPLAGTQLEPIVHGNHFWFAWAAFAPETTVWTAP
jgi:hypothetical protein